VQWQAETVWRQARRHRVAPRAFVNKMDRAGAAFEGALAQLRSKLDAPDVGDAGWAVERDHVDDEVVGIGVRRLDRRLPALQRRRQSAGLRDRVHQATAVERNGTLGVAAPLARQSFLGAEST
jgi:elongation factor G